ncbi:MAG: hypothetical protein INF55_17350 [Roseomonas sp.]|jgi:hypothetical protein|nr:hypothetical protein [Roseomonas sp.]
MRLREILQKSRNKSGAQQQETAETAAGISPSPAPDRQLLHEGRPKELPNKTTVRIDKPVLPGQRHAHLNRKGESERIINADGTSSHKTGPFKIDDTEAKFLVDKGFSIPPSRLVEDLKLEASTALVEERSRKLTE